MPERGWGGGFARGVRVAPWQEGTPGFGVELERLDDPVRKRIAVVVGRRRGELAARHGS